MIACKLISILPLLQLTDGNGVYNGGIAITVWEEINSSQHGYIDFIKEVRCQRRRRLAARSIARFLRYCKTRIGAINKMHGFQYQDKVKSKRFFGKSNAKSSMTSSASNALRSKLKRAKYHLSPENRESFEQYPDVIIRLGEESYNFMQDAAELGERCIVQKCYVMMGGEKSEQFLQFRSLQHLVKMDSKVSYLFKIFFPQ